MVAQTMEPMTERITVEQEARLVRARAESGDYTWTMSPLGWVVTTASGKTYQVDEKTCSCEDARRRCAGTLLICKHSLALREKLLAEQRRGTPQVAADKEDEARRAARASIFE